MQEEPKYRIGPIAIFVLIILAFIADLIGLIPFAKDFTATLFWIGAGIYFYFKKMGIFNGKKLAAVAISWVISLVPVLQEIPCEIVAGVIAVIIITRIEDKTGLSVLKPLSEGKQIASLKGTLNFAGRREPPARIPLNQANARKPQDELTEGDFSAGESRAV